MRDSVIHLILRLRAAPTWLTEPDFDRQSPVLPTSCVQALKRLALKRLALRRAAMLDWIRCLSADRRCFVEQTGPLLDSMTCQVLWHAARTAQLYFDDVARLCTEHCVERWAPIKRRIMHELPVLQENPDVVDVTTLEGSFIVVLYQCSAQSDIYADSFWVLRFKIPVDYPFRSFRLTTLGLLPHVNLHSSEISLDSNWAPNRTIFEFVERFGRVLQSPSGRPDLIADRQQFPGTFDISLYRQQITSLFLSN